MGSDYGINPRRQITKLGAICDRLGVTVARLAAEVATALTDLNCTILTCNQQAALLLGFEHAAELVGRNAFDFFAPEDVERAVSNAQATLRSGAVRDIEYTVVKKDGTRFRVVLSASLICDPDGNPQAFTAVIRDITDRKSANESVGQTQTPSDAHERRAFTGPLLVLSGREAEVYRLLLAGHSNKEIAAELVISVKTVEFHISHILQKLRVKSRVEAILKGLPNHPAR